MCNMQMVQLNIFHNYYRIILTEEVVYKAARKSLNIYYELMGLQNLTLEATQTEWEPGGLAKSSSGQTKTKSWDNHNCLIWNLKEMTMDC